MRHTLPAEKQLMICIGGRDPLDVLTRKIRESFNIPNFKTNYKDEKDNTFIHHLLMQQYDISYITAVMPDLCSLYLQQGGDINAKNKNEKTPLMLAVENYPLSLDLVGMLLKAGASYTGCLEKIIDRLISNQCYNKKFSPIPYTEALRLQADIKIQLLQYNQEGVALLEFADNYINKQIKDFPSTAGNDSKKSAISQDPEATSGESVEEEGTHSFII